MLASTRTPIRTSTAAAGSDSSRGSDPRTLYLGKTSCQRVDANGDALVVSVQREVGSFRRLRFPLERVLRVVSSTAVDWSGNAIQSCLQRHINICWLDCRGEPLGSLHSHYPQTCPFDAALDLLLESSEGVTRYQTWLRSRRQQVQLQWGRTSSVAISPQQWEAVKRSWVYQAQLAPHLPFSMRGLVAASITHHLEENQLLPIQIGPRGEPVLLSHDLTELIWAEMNLCCGPLTDKTEGSAEVTLFFERWWACNGSALSAHLASLQRVASKELRA